MVSLTDFSSTLNPQECPARSGRLCALPVQEVVSGKSGVTDYYPEILITCDAFNTSSGNLDFDSRPTLLIPISEPPLKRVIRTFFESGIQEAISEARNDRTSLESPVLKSTADFANRIVEILYKLKTKIIPGLKEKGPGAIAAFSETRDWVNSKVRCISWHPNCFKLAIAGSDDVIRIYNDSGALPSLKTSSQKLITSMAWRPFTASDLAVACQNGICYWSVDSSLHFNRQMICGTILKYPNHEPVTSIEWNPDGSLLASASISSTDVLIWDVDKVASAPLKRVGFPCSILKWSPDGTSLFSSTVGNVFRVWSTEKQWTPDRWTIGNGYIQSAAWSPCNSFLLFVNSNEPILYQLQFVEEQFFTNGTSTKQALPIADLQKVLINGKELGGLPQSIAWDPNGNYLAIIFKDSPNIAVFSTAISKYNLSISPSCYLSGQTISEYPSYICFQSKHSKNTNSVLTIGWSNGRVQYFSFH